MISFLDAKKELKSYAVLEKIKKQRKEWIQNDINEAEAKQLIIYNKINLLPYPFKDVLINLYVFKNTIEKTCDNMNYSPSHINRLKDKGIVLYSKSKVS